MKISFIAEGTHTTWQTPSARLNAVKFIFHRLQFMSLRCHTKRLLSAIISFAKAWMAVLVTQYVVNQAPSLTTKCRHRVEIKWTLTQMNRNDVLALLPHATIPLWGVSSGETIAVAFHMLANFSGEGAEDEAALKQRNVQPEGMLLHPRLL
jgi:hypothetical protein